ncbi:BT4734/BF3469 family protein [Asinibacterium sp. OR53]|uniref:BT4734/BF3469 family protein n=1 Tax=Asinibacterium sp. OR53 TaxID=925409 RepID=UPI0004B725F3|nr:BT4734/BF3469 family protein [Asinibacterium sp. OR53]
MKQTISNFRNMSVPTGVMSLQQVYDLIIGDDLMEQTNQLRTLLREGKKTEFDEQKKKLPAVTFSGEFEGGRKTENLVRYTQHVCLDFDKIPTPEELERAKAIIKDEVITKLVFVSPSGKGLKVVVEVEASVENHKDVYAQVAKYYADKIGFPADHTSDVPRLTFLCWDKDAFFNELYEVVAYQPVEKKQEVKKPVERNGSPIDCQVREIFEYAISFTERVCKFEEGSRNKFVLTLASNCNKWGLCKDFVIDLCIDRYTDSGFDEKEIERVVNNAYKNTELYNTWNRPVIIQPEVLISKETLPIVNEIAEDTTSFFNDDVYDNLPGLIRDVTDVFTVKREKDMFLLSFVTIISGHLHSITGWYIDDLLYANIYSLLIAPAASGKRMMSKAMDIFSWVDANKKTNYAPLISINGTFKSIISQLNNSDGTGVLYDEEIEALSKLLKYDKNGMSFILKQGYDNRVLRNGRVASNQEIVQTPKFSFLTAGNPHQLPNVVPVVSDGAFSRNLFYTYNDVTPFYDVRPGGWKHFVEQKEEYTEQLSTLIDFTLSHPFDFTFTDDQFDRIRTNGLELQQQYNVAKEQHMDQVIKRNGRAIFKIAMLLSAFRKWSERNSDNKYICHDTDFNTAFSMIETLTVHAYFAGQILKGEGKTTVSSVVDRKTKMLEAVPDCFTKDDAEQVIKDLGFNVHERTVYNDLQRLEKDGVLTHEHNKYCKKATL